MTKRGYHHGNLRQALVEAALALIEEKGPQGFTLSEAAKAADVTPAAVYRHFAGPRRADRRGRAAGLRDLRGADGLRLQQRPAHRAGRVRGDGPRLSRLRPQISRPLPGDVRKRPVGQQPPRSRRWPPRKASGVLEKAATALSAHIPPEKRPPPAMFSAHIWAMSHGVVELFTRGAPGARSPFPPEDLLEAGHRHLPARPRPAARPTR